MEPRIAPSESRDAVQEPRERNWAPVAIAAVVVVALMAVGLFMGRPGKSAQDAVSASAPDPYAAQLKISDLQMSESANLAGGKVTYLDGHIANLGDRTVSEVTVQVLFRDYANKLAQTQKMPLTVIRMRDPYVYTARMSALPLRPGAQQDFRLIFDAVSPDWAGSLPEVQILRVAAK